MNKRRYRLVFDPLSGMLAPVARRAGGPSVAAATLVALLLAGEASAAPPLAAGALPAPAANFVSRGAASLSQAGHTLTVNQSTNKAVLNWTSFNIAADSAVRFAQPTTASATLNRIGGLDPSIIQGSLSANGHIYLVNGNGILFDQGAQINVGGLVASALNVSDDVFMNGLLSVTGMTPAFTWEGSAEQFGTSLVRVEHGAQIITGAEGRVMLLAPRVENQGRIETPEGQTILAAGAKVYLAAPLDPKLRGFLVEVDPFTGADADGAAVNLGGAVSNEKLGEKVGQIVAERGNITLAALAVKQDGTLRATTSVDMNGSIYLLARDTAVAEEKDLSGGGRVTLASATRMGSLEFGAGSVTEVAPDVTSTRTLQDEQIFNKSTVEGYGKTVHVRGAGDEGPGAVLRAPGGEIRLTAQRPDLLQPGVGAEQARIYVGQGATFDVAGLRDVEIPIERHIIEVELRGNELKDSPLQRDGILRGEIVQVDARTGTPLADISGWVAQIQRGIKEKSSAGGRIALKSEGDVVVREGATLDVSGGSLKYLDGDTGASKLVSGNQVFDIGSAPADRVYTGLVKDTTRREAGYVEGKNAGSLDIFAPKVALDGNLKGDIVAGPYQRESGKRPLGGRLLLGELTETKNPETGEMSSAVSGYIASHMRFDNGAAPLPAGFGIDSSLPDTLSLNTGIFSDGGFTRLQLHTGGRIELPAGAKLATAAGGEIAMSGRQVDVQGKLSAPAGTIGLATNSDGLSNDPADYALRIGPGASLAAAGMWVNDLPGVRQGDGSDAAFINGGTVSIESAGNVLLAAGSVVDVSGGGWLRADGKLKLGNAGAIRIESGSVSASGRAEAEATLDGVLRAYALSDGATTGKGGKLILQGSNVSLGGSVLDLAGELHLSETLFRQGGFKDFQITGVETLAVAAGARIAPAPESRVLGRGAYASASGADVASFTDRRVLPEEQRTAGSVKLAANSKEFGSVTLGRDAQLAMEPGGAIELEAQRSILVDGVLSAPGGRIVLTLPEPVSGDQFEADRAIWLGSHSRLLAPGYARMEPNASGLRQGEVQGGGSVEVRAGNGYLVTQTGSGIDVSGAEAVLDILRESGGRVGYLPTVVGSGGGSVTLAAREGMLLDGGFEARGGAGALGGALNVELETRASPWLPSADSGLNALLAAPRRLVLTQSHDAGTGAMATGQILDAAAHNGRAVVAADKVQAGGFADVALRGKDRIEIDGAVSLDAARSITLEAPNLVALLGAAAQLMAAHVVLGNTRSDRQAEALREDASGGGALAVAARNIELAGNMALQGFGDVTLDSADELRLRAVDVNPSASTVDYRGSFVTGGDLELKAAQVYPTTFSNFSVEIHNNPEGVIGVSRNGGDTPVLSAAGELSLAAPHIVHDGALKAPFGGIELKSEIITRTTTLAPDGTRLPTVTRAAAPDGSVTLGAESLTSVSAEGQIIPFGKTQLSGKEWIYAFADANKTLALPPEKRVSIQGERLDIAAGASIDLSGGGDLHAWEFTTGPGGSKDVLDPAVSPNTYAIVPGLQAQVAPVDEQSGRGVAGLAPGDSIEILNGAAGLAPGTHTLLPARYALLPGAYTVTFKGGADALPGQATRNPDGSWQLAAYRGSLTQDGGYVRSARSEFVEIAPGDVARTKSEYRETRVGDFFAGAAGAQQAGDAGRLSLQAGRELFLEGRLITDYVEGHRGAEVDIAANRLAVTRTGANERDDVVELGIGDLNRLGAASLLLGGTREGAAAGVAVSVAASTVEIDAGGETLGAPELLLAAREGVTVKSGSTVAGEGAFSGEARDLALSGDGALLRVSSGEQVALARGGVTRSAGVLEVQEGATVRGGSVILDATKDNRVDGDIVLAGNGALTVGANRISVGETAGVTEGLVFSDEKLAKLGSPESLVLKSYSTLDLYGAATLGGAGMKSLAVEAAGIAGYANTGQAATVVADEVRFANPDVLAFSPAGALGDGVLQVSARRVVLDQGDFTVRGFDRSQIDAATEIRAEGKGSHEFSGDLTLAAGRIAGAGGAEQEIAATGALWTVALPADAAMGAADFGGRLVLSGSRIEHGGRIDLPSGVLTLSATGAEASDGVMLAAGSQINAAGVAVPFADTFAYAPGGEVRLESKSGDVSIAAGSRVDVSGAEGGAAGRLAVSAASGNFASAGELKGGAASSRQGEFFLDAGALDSFSALNASLNAGGFTGARDLRLRTGDVQVNAGETVTARTFALAADAGRIDVRGTVDATDGDKGGRIELHGATGVALHDGAQLIARAGQGPEQVFGTRGRGGSVTLAAPGGQVEVNAGSLIDVSGAGAGAGGSVLLRAPRTGSGASADLAMAPVAGDIVGAADVVAEGVKVYSAYSSIKSGATSAAALGMTSVHNDSNTDFSAANVARMEARLGFADTATTHYRMRPGVEVRSSGDLTLSNDWDLRTARYNGEPGVLTLRAAGDVKLNNSLSDGFSSAATTGTLLLSGSESWTYRIVAGADAGAANPLAVKAAAQLAGKGDVVIAAGKLVRTGSGGISIASGRDLVMSGGAAIYTAGKADDPGEFGIPTNIRSRRGEYAYGGGDVSLFAARNLVGSGADLWVNQWLYRQGSALDANGNLPNTSGIVYRPTWWARLDEFKRGVGALGGGDVNISAGGDIDNLGVAIPTNGRLTGAAGSIPDAANLKVLGGGDLDIRAGGDINSGLFTVARGEATIAAGGMLGSSRTETLSGAPVHTAVVLGEAQASLHARGDATLEAAFNATLAPQASGNLLPPARRSFFSTYSPNASVALTSLNGDVTLVNDVTKLGRALNAPSSGQDAMRLYPGSLRVAALKGDIAIDGAMTLAPAPQGQLELLAGGSIDLAIRLAMSDMPEAALPTALSPDATVSARISKVAGSGAEGAQSHSSPPLHGADTEPVRIVAKTGDIAGPGVMVDGGNPTYATFILSKKATIEAGRDIEYVSLQGQNLAPEDVTTIKAGRDILQGTDRNNDGVVTHHAATIELGGPGRLEVVAGRDLSLGSSKGIITRGNFNNPFLADEGAHLFVLAGAASGNFGALKSLLEQPGQERLRELSQYDAAATNFMRERTGNAGLPTPEALAAFGQLSEAEQRPVLIDAFYAALRGAGRLALNEGLGAYQYGYHAIATVFPGSVASDSGAFSTGPYQGNINLFFSQLKTEQGGGIDILAPGGMVDGGLASYDERGKHEAKDLGIITARGGSVRGFVSDDFLVNGSRVFTLQGGDILIWSSYGNIDAGKGAKTASAAPPPQIIVRGDQVILDTSNSVAGSGIGVLLGKAGIEPGNVDLIAPVGEVNAGDAGIRSTGNVTIAAARVVGADNIQAGGATAGVPQVESGAGASGPAGGGSVAADAASAAQQFDNPAPTSAGPPNSLFTVEVVGLGEEDDERQKSN